MNQIVVSTCLLIYQLSQNEYIKNQYKTFWIEKVDRKNKAYYIRRDTGQKHGSFTKFWYDRKIVSVIANYKNGALHGEYKSYFDRPGILHMVCDYIDGKIHGIVTKHLDTSNAAKEMLYYNNGREYGKTITVHQWVVYSCTYSYYSWFTTETRGIRWISH